VTYSKSLHDFVRFNLNGEPIDDNKLYKIGLQHFHFLNVEKFFSVPLAEIEENGKPRMVSTSCREILDEYLSVHPNLERSVTGRLIVED
jgi:5'-nucleotidase